MDDNLSQYQNSEMDELRQEKAAYARKSARLRNNNRPDQTGER